MRPPPPSAGAALREVLTGGTIRHIAGISDQGEVSLVKAHNADGGDLTDTDNGGTKDIWVHYVDEMSATPDDDGHPGIARLHLPGNILFAIPNDMDTAVIVRPREAHGPGIPYLLLGDGGTDNRVPDWATASTPKDGLYTPRTLRLESKDNDVEINVGTDNKSLKITCGGTSITVDKDGDVTIIPGSGKVVSLGDTSGNTFGEAVYDGSGHLKEWCSKVETLVNDLRTAVIDTIGDVNNLTVVGEAYLEGTPLPTATADKSTLQSDDPIPDPPAPSTLVQNK